MTTVRPDAAPEPGALLARVLPAESADERARALHRAPDGSFAAYFSAFPRPTGRTARC